MARETLEQYGWNSHTGAAWQKIKMPELLPGRVIADFGSYLRVKTPKLYQATVVKKLRHTHLSEDLPKVGDWVVIRPEDEEVAVVEAVLPRYSAVVRKANALRPEPQVLAANIDIAFVVQALNEDFNLQRLDRYAFQLVESGVEPVFVFNKQDLATSQKQKELKEWGKPLMFTNAYTGEGVSRLRDYLRDGKTAVFIGSSGTGKSTLVNQLLGESRQKVGETGVGDKGRHTTSHRELFLVPEGGIIIDTPGIRELQLWGEEGSLEAVFPDIMELAKYCRFRNCRHTSKEKGCAVQQALRDGTLTQKRFESYQKLRNELAAG